MDQIKEKIIIFLKSYWMLLLVGVILAALAVYALFIEPNMLVVKRYSYEMPNWSKANDHLKIAVLTDLHILPSWKDSGRLDRIAATVNAEQPDLIFFLGDFINGMAGKRGNLSMDDLTAFMKQFKSRHGIFAIAGNHEFWFGAGRVEKALAAAGVRFLKNDAEVLRINRKRVAVAGTGDYQTGNPDLVRSLRYVRDEDPVFLLSHNPEILPFVPPRVGLTLCGHTHGGQLRLPWIGTRFMPEMVRSKYEPGLEQYNGRALLQSSGIGGSPIRARFCCPPEIVILTVRSPEGETK